MKPTDTTETLQELILAAKHAAGTLEYLATRLRSAVFNAEAAMQAPPIEHDGLAARATKAERWVITRLQGIDSMRRERPGWHYISRIFPLRLVDRQERMAAFDRLVWSKRVGVDGPLCALAAMPKTHEAPPESPGEASIGPR